jgi:hypothetical protein
MQSSFTARSAYGDMVMEEQMDGGLVIQVRDGIESSQIRLTPDQVSALRIWLDSMPPAAPVVRTAGGIDYVAWRNRIRRAAGQHPEA